MTIKVLLEATAKSDLLEDSYAGIHATLEQTRAFPGAVSLEVLIDDADPAKVVVIETWESVEAHDAYVAWRATREGAPRALIAVLAGPPSTRVFTEATEL